MLSPSARALLLGVATLAACGGSASDIEEIKKGQKDILAKLDGLDKTVQQLKAQPAAAQRPQMDPNKVYTIPIGDSPVKGPKQARVTIAEFSDFQ
jgi:protein-disulfide isomerase